MVQCLSVGYFGQKNCSFFEYSTIVTRSEKILARNDRCVPHDAGERDGNRLTVDAKRKGARRVTNLCQWRACWLSIWLRIVETERMGQVRAIDGVRGMRNIHSRSADSDWQVVKSEERNQRIVKYANEIEKTEDCFPLFLYNNLWKSRRLRSTVMITCSIHSKRHFCARWSASSSFLSGLIR